MSREISAQIDTFITKLRRRQVIGSYNVALDTARLLRNVVAATRWKKVQDLIDKVREVGKWMEQAQPTELAVLNMVKRVLHIIREETNALRDELKKHSEAGDDSTMADDGTITDATMKDKMKAHFKQGIAELIDELETARGNIAEKSWKHIHSGEIIMTIGKSRTVEQFLKEAAKHRTFQVIVVETAPFYNGQEMASALSASGIDCILISDSALFAVMSRVNKVIIGAHAVTANGGAVAVSGSHIVAEAAKYHSIPVVVCSGLYKVSPSYPYDTDIYNQCVSPESVYNFGEDTLDKIDVLNPYFDFLSPDKLALFITNGGSHPPSFIPRLILESYSPEDLET